MDRGKSNLFKIFSLQATNSNIVVRLPITSYSPFTHIPASTFNSVTIYIHFCCTADLLNSFTQGTVTKLKRPLSVSHIVSKGKAITNEHCCQNKKIFTYFKSKHGTSQVFVYKIKAYFKAMSRNAAHFH